MTTDNTLYYRNNKFSRFYFLSLLLIIVPIYYFLLQKTPIEYTKIRYLLHTFIVLVSLSMFYKLLTIKEYWVQKNNKILCLTHHFHCIKQKKTLSVEKVFCSFKDAYLGRMIIYLRCYDNTIHPMLSYLKKKDADRIIEKIKKNWQD